MASLSVFVVVACGVLTGTDIALAQGTDTLALRDTAAVRAAAAAHFAVPDSAVLRAVTIRGDTAWAHVYHDRITFTVVRLRREGSRWRFEREAAHGIH